MSPRIHTDLATIRHALDLTDQHNAPHAARTIGVHHKTIYRWIAMRDQRHPAWPTPAEIADWQRDDAERRDYRARKAALQADLRKRWYLNGGPIHTPAIGTTRRVRALHALGWTAPELGQRLGLSAGRVRQLLDGNAEKVKPETVDRINRLYAELSMSAPPDKRNRRRGEVNVHERTRRLCRRKGWVPPLAWNDDEIDDPTATPDVGDTPDRVNGGTGRRSTDVAEDVAFLLEHDPTLTSAQLADRLGYQGKSAIQHALDRAGRRDLLARLARNAEERAA
jgi:transcriptional regulator with XRE-family HTH domain